jgi:hypothetical protein
VGGDAAVADAARVHHKLVLAAHGQPDGDLNGAAAHCRRGRDRRPRTVAERHDPDRGTTGFTATAGEPERRWNGVTRKRLVNAVVLSSVWEKPDSVIS